MYNVLVIYDVLNFASTIMNKFSFFVLSWKNLISDVFFFLGEQSPKGDISYLQKFFILYVGGRFPLHFQEDFCGTALLRYLFLFISFGINKRNIITLLVSILLILRSFS